MSRKWTRWTNEEDALLESLLHLSKPMIATRMGRTEYGIEQRMRRKGWQSKYVPGLDDAEVERRDVAVGAIAVGKYAKHGEKREYKCPQCGSHFLRLPASVWDGAIKCEACQEHGRLSQDEADRRDREMGAISIEPYKTLTSKRRYKCPECGVEISRKPSEVWGGRVVCKECSYKRNRLDPDIVHGRVRAVGGILVGEYLGEKTLTTFECPECGAIFQRRPKNVIEQNQIYCRQCGGAGGQRLTNDEHVRRTRAVGGIPHDEYVANTTKIRFKCPECDILFKRRPDMVWSGRVRCLSCAGSNGGFRWTEEEVIRKTEEVGGEFIGPYTKAKDKCRFKCPQCGDVFLREPHEVWKHKRVLCIKCSHRSNYGCFLPEKVAHQKTIDCGGIPHGPYKGAHQKTTFECPECGGIFERTPNNVWLINSICCNACKLQGRSKIVEEELLPLICEVLGKDYDPSDVIEQRVPGWGGGVDILINDIAIEYDSYYWHRMKQDVTDKEQGKDKVLLESGYRILRIRSSGSDMPVREELEEAFDKLETQCVVEIECYSWRMKKYNHLYPIDPKLEMELNAFFGK